MKLGLPNKTQHDMACSAQLLSRRFLAYHECKLSSHQLPLRDSPREKSTKNLNKSLGKVNNIHSLLNVALVCFGNGFVLIDFFYWCCWVLWLTLLRATHHTAWIGPSTTG